MSSSKSLLKLNTFGHEATPELQKKSFSVRKLPLNRSKPKRSNTESGVLDSPFRDKKVKRKGLEGQCIMNMKLSPMKQYETRLKISGECWMVYDYKKSSYIRGWRPNQYEEFSGLLRLVLLKTFTELVDQNSEIENFMLRTNCNLLNEEIQRAKQEKLSPKKRKGYIHREPISRIFDNYTVISMIDVLYGLFLTTYDDILEYAIIFMGYLCYCVTEEQKITSGQLPYHFIDKVCEAKAYTEYFGQYIETKLFPKLQLHNTVFKASNSSLASSCNDICTLFRSIENDRLFQEILGCQEKPCQIKYQVGYHYWQNRQLIFKNKRINLGQEYLCTLSWRGHKNFGVICWNNELGTLTVIGDCKFGMAELDIDKIEQWIKGSRKKIVEVKKQKPKLKPIMKISADLRQQSVLPLKNKNFRRVQTTID